MVTVTLVLSLFSLFSSVNASTCMGLPPFSPELVTACTPASLPLFLDPTIRHSAPFPPLLDMISFNCLLGRVSTYVVGTVFTSCYGFEHPKNYRALRIIQLLKTYLNQVLRSAFARNISKVEQETPGIINEHQYGQPHQTCLIPVLNKLLIVQLLI
jgi:hypothetical protein